MNSEITRTIINKRTISIRKEILGLFLPWCIGVTIFARYSQAVVNDAEFSLFHPVYIAALLVALALFALLVYVPMGWFSACMLAHTVRLERNTIIVKKHFQREKCFNLGNLDCIATIPIIRCFKYITYLSEKKDNYLLTFKGDEHIRLSGDMEGLDEFIHMISQKSGVEIKYA